MGNNGLLRNKRQAAIPTAPRKVGNGTLQGEGSCTAFGRPAALCAERGFAGRRGGVRESTPSGLLFHVFFHRPHVPRAHSRTPPSRPS